MTLLMQNVLQQAEVALDFWEEDSMWYRLIERDIMGNDLESLAFHVREANAQMDIAKQNALASHRFDLYLQGRGELPNLLESLPEVPMPELKE